MTVTTDRIEDKFNEKKINNCEHKSTGEGKKMLKQELKVKPNPSPRATLILTDHFSLDYIKENEAAIKYQLIDRNRVIELLHSDLYEVYSCVQSQKVRNIYQREFLVEVPMIANIYECTIDTDDFYHNTWILAPLISEYDIDRDEMTLNSILTSSGPRYILYTMAKEVV